MLIIATTIVCRRKTHYGIFCIFAHYLYKPVIPHGFAQHVPLLPADETYCTSTISSTCSVCDQTFRCDVVQRPWLMTFEEHRLILPLKKTMLPWRGDAVAVFYRIHTDPIIKQNNDLVFPLSAQTSDSASGAVVQRAEYLWPEWRAAANAGTCVTVVNDWPDRLLVVII